MTTAADVRVPILMYHEIAPPTETHSRLAVSPENFAAQLGYLRSAGFTTLTAAELSARLTTGAGRLPDRPVVLTFDDGYADFHRRAMPVLAQHGFTATLFVTTGWEQDADMRRSAPGRMLTRTQLAEVAAAGIELGSAHSQPPSARPAARAAGPRRARLKQGMARGHDRAAGPGAGLSLRLLERPGQAGCARGRLPLRARRRQQDGRRRGGPIPAAAAHRPAGHHPARIPSAGRRPADAAAARRPRAHPRLVGRPPGQGGVLLVT